MHITISDTAKTELLFGIAAAWQDVMYLSLWNGREIPYESRKPVRSGPPVVDNGSTIIPLYTAVTWDDVPTLITGLAVFTTPDSVDPIAIIPMSALAHMTIELTPTNPQ